MRAGSAAVTRQATARLGTFDLAALQPQLPLRFPSAATQDVPEHLRTRSWYRYPGWAGYRQAQSHTNGASTRLPHCPGVASACPNRGALWKQHYGSRRNATESRNSQLEHLGLKRIWSYGLSGATADIAFADLLINLRTLGRLVQQATLLDS